MVGYTILTLRIDLEEIKALHLPLGTSTPTLPVARSRRTRRAKDSPCQRCPCRGPSASPTRGAAPPALPLTPPGPPRVRRVYITVKSEGWRSNCGHKKGTHQLRKKFLTSNRMPPGGGKWRNNCVSGRYQNMDPFSEEIFMPYHSITQISDGNTSNLPLVRGCPDYLAKAGTLFSLLF